MKSPAPTGYVERPDPGAVWRIGYRPDPWAWTDWAYASNGHFDGRLYAPAGEYRTVYAGSSYFACLVEVLARLRPEPAMVAISTLIHEDEVDAAIYATVDAGIVDPAWFAVRRVAQAKLGGSSCDVSESGTIGNLRGHFAAMAIGGFGLADFDASALLNSGPRSLSQQVGRFIYGLSRGDGSSFDVVRLLSHHGADLELWVVFERSDDEVRSRHLTEVTVHPVDPASEDVIRAMRLHALTLG